jgi:hypothetical protein
VSASIEIPQFTSSNGSTNKPVCCTARGDTLH